jgi:uncharacterized protein DUF2800
MWRTLIKELSVLNEKMHVLLIGHAQIKSFQDPELPTAYDRYQLKINDKAAALVREAAEDLDQLYQSVLVVINSLADPGDPTPGDHCHFCPARLVCSAAREQAESAMLAKVLELPVGEQAAELLVAIKRAQALFKEIEAYYKRVLESSPGSIPGWALVPGDMRRSIDDPLKAMERLIESLSVSEFLSCCAPSVPSLEKAWARKNNVPSTQVRRQFNRLMDGIIAEKRTAPSLRQATN